ncbi:ABC transporter permease [Actinoplanes sp. LDG1-06]|uniref:Transport permease protein n=1 Tax=Paractinoplanes ovalisporus TaxID=2810368 RepID=A0ABS2AI46_9ACTN|nr:ABC transporter permease [Actinoplanes ovalisporus]MBM2619515.1 ABC transporter permease [Actinoplanes ovalisporus]
MSYVLTDSAALFGRHLTHFKRLPQQLISVTLMPIMFVFLFGYLFGSSMVVPDGKYLDYIMAGILAQMMLANAINTGVGVADDLNNGLVDRFRSLPMTQFSVLLGRTAADLVLNIIALLFMVLVGLLMGWRPHGSALSTIGGVALLLLLGYTMTWLGCLIGLTLRHPQVINSVAMAVTMPLAFLSAGFFPINNLPGWVSAIASWNPVSAIVTGVRELWGNPVGYGDDPSWPLRHPVPVSLITLIVLLLIIVPLATRAYRSAAAKTT